MRDGATKLFGADLFMGNGLHDIGSRDEHIARLFYHQRKIRNGGGIHSSPRTGAEDRGNLGHNPRRERIPEEYSGIPAEADNPLLNARAAGVVQSDHRTADFHREIHHFCDLLRVDLRERPAEDREVLAENTDKPPADRSCSGDDPVSQVLLLVKPKIARPVFGEHIHLLKAPLVEENRQALTGRELPLSVLVLNPFPAAAEQRLFAEPAQILDGIP